jgi:hypothetical protein
VRVSDQIASLRLAGRGISRFPCNELPHMPGSSTTPGPPGARACAPVCIAFRLRNGVSTRDMNLCGAQWLAYVLLCRRFAAALAGDRARLEVDVDRYSFIVSDLHRLLIAGLPAHCEKFWTTIKREYVRVSPRPDAETVMRQLPAWIAHYNEVHSHKALGYRSPREFIAAHARP